MQLYTNVWEKILIEGGLHRQSHNIPLITSFHVYVSQNIQRSISQQNLGQTTRQLPADLFNLRTECKLRSAPLKSSTIKRRKPQRCLASTSPTMIQVQLDVQEKLFLPVRLTSLSMTPLALVSCNINSLTSFEFCLKTSCTLALKGKVFFSKIGISSTYVKGTFRDHRVTGAANFHQIRDVCMFTSVLYVLT